MPWAGLGWREFWARTWIVWVLAPLTGLTIALYGQTSGAVYVEWLFVRVSEGSLVLALATTLRVLAIALPSVVLFATVDPTDLADGLGQVLKLPARFVLGALAGLRMVGLFLDDWRALELARRARGVADRGRVRRFFGMAFALLVLSIRRGSKLATAMEARGFGAPGERTWARESRFGGAEWALMAVGLGIARRRDGGGARGRHVELHPRSRRLTRLACRETRVRSACCDRWAGRVGPSSGRQPPATSRSAG